MRDSLNEIETVMTSEVSEVSVKHVDTNEVVRELIYKDVFEFFDQCFEPTRMQVLSQRYNARLKRLGHASVNGFVTSDERLLVKVSRKGGRFVVPREAFGEFIKGVPDPYAYWSNYGVPSV